MPSTHAASPPGRSAACTPGPPPMSPQRDWPTPAVPSEHNPARDRPHRTAPDQLLGRLVIGNPPVTRLQKECPLACGRGSAGRFPWCCESGI
jgi:hypothetical protein